MKNFIQLMLEKSNIQMLNRLSETIEIELERQCRDNIMDYLEHWGDPAVMRSSFCAMTWMLDEYLGMAECQHRDIAEEALSGLSWWVIYGDHPAITEAVSLRTSLGLIPAAKMFDAKKMPMEYGVILDFIKTKINRNRFN